MHIDENRSVSASFDVPEKIERDDNSNDSSMKNPKISKIATTSSSISVASPTETIETFSEVDEIETIVGTDVSRCSTINDRSMNDRIVYATIDRLALKRTRLPLQLVPIEDVAATIEKKDRNNGEKRVNANRKTSPRRPSFKVRPGIATSGGQWKSRSSRSTPRDHRNTSNFENVSKRLVSRLVIFENIIRDNNDRNCSTINEKRIPATGKISNRKTTELRIPEIDCSNDERSNVIHSKPSRNFRNAKEIFADEAKSRRERASPVSSKHRYANQTDYREDGSNFSNVDDDGTKVRTATRKSTSQSQRTTENNNESFEAKRNNFASEKHEFDESSISSTTTKTTVGISKNKKYHRSEFSSTKNFPDNEKNVPDNQKSSKTSNNLLKNRKNDCSRDELRSSISFPTNFVHLASATNSKLRPDGDVITTKSKTLITHELKRAELRYHRPNDNYQEIEIAKPVGKIVKNSNVEKTTYVEIEKRIPNVSTETRRSGCSDETSNDWSSMVSSSSSSSSISENEKYVDGNANRAKVRSLENSRGVPEVVKTSENEGTNVDDPNPENNDANVTDYEPMSEFSSTTVNADSTNFSRGKTTANASFLWRQRTSDKPIEQTTNGRANREKIACFGRENVAKDDCSVGDVGCDTYDDVGLSQVDTEEDHYDDVGFPWTEKKMNSSTDTLFEEINNPENVQLYDDVVPNSTNRNSSIENYASRDNDNSSVIKSPNLRKSDEISVTGDRSSAIGRKNSEMKNRENEYFSISNDYSSVDEDIDDFEGQDDGLYDDVELPSQERVNSLYAGSSSGSQLGSVYNGKESEWEDLEEAAPVLPFPKKNNVGSRHGDCQTATNKKKSVQRWSRKVRQQKSKASRKNSGSRSTSRGTASRGTSTISDTASDDSNYETVLSVGSDEFTSDSTSDDDASGNPTIANVDDPNSQIRPNEIYGEAPSRPVPPPPRESSLTETFGKQMKMLRRTWSITKGSLGRMRRRTSSIVENETIVDDFGKYLNNEQPQISNNDGKKYFGFKKHFKKSMTGLSTFYLDNENREETLSRNNNSSKEEVNSDCSNSSWYTNTDYWKNSVTEQSRRDNVDHYSMLDEEPLYQFYAAAAARVAFESDSEGYEEVEDPTPSPSTVELAKPGHRTLWCQTPQVINSALLQRLTPEVKKIQEAKFEIFTSEASYLNSLRVLVDEFLNDHELVHEVLTPSEREKLFGGVPSVLLASEKLLAEMETVWREDSMLRGLPDVLSNYAQRSSKVYVAYCSNQVSIDTTLNELRNKKGSKFVDTVKRIESHAACQSLSLHSFLMLPMQRVTRLPLLADAVLSKVTSENKEERTCWECVLSQLSQVVMECNEGARAAGRLAEMEALERKLEYSSKVPPIILRDRYLVRRGPVVQMLAKPDAEYKLTFGKKHHKTPLYLLLLTDYLLIAKLKSSTNEETYTVIDSCKRSLVELEKVTDDSPFAGRNAMVLTLLENHSGRHVEYIVTCKSATERERWLDAVSPPKPNLVGESLYETWDCPQVMALYPYAAAQPDELNLQPGDVINVLRKMTDGWHLGEKLLAGEQGWFPGNYAKEVASEHVRARNLRQRHRLLALSASVLQTRAKQTSRLH